MDRKATAGNSGEQTRSDCLVRLRPLQKGGIILRLESRVGSLFGEQIRQQVQEVLNGLGICHAEVEMEDSGALPFVIAARLEAAVKKLGIGGEPWIPEMIPGNRYESTKDRFRFTRLYLPGNTPRMMLNAGIHQPDGIILDLEDSVAPDRKTEAALLVRNALRQVDFYGAERMVRINQLPGGLEDLEYIVPHHVHVILIPKCESPDQVRQVDERVRTILQEAGQDRVIYYMPIIESCLGVERAFGIATSSDRVAAMAIGLEDYTADLGVKRTPEGKESLYARTRLVNACKAAGIQPIDSVFSDVDDMEGLKVNVLHSRGLGFEGMGCIHPRQVAVIREGFRPREEEIVRAEEIINAFREAGARGEGVIAIGSKMIDPPVVRRAWQTMELAYRFGLRSDPGPSPLQTSETTDQ
ncbi:MAG TPA: citrate lyase ACP [Bacteroides sp.]|mgnify:CR=1 FL=1|nr:citrate lyase ACP [Bacteroides sp.]